MVKEKKHNNVHKCKTGFKYICDGVYRGSTRYIKLEVCEGCGRKRAIDFKTKQELLELIKLAKQSDKAYTNTTI